MLLFYKLDPFKFEEPPPTLDDVLSVNWNE